MNIKKKILVEFLRKIQMDGLEKITEILLKFEATGLKCSANTTQQTSRVSGILKKEAFEDYKAIGNVGVNDLDILIKVIDRFGEKVVLDFEGNLLTIKGNGKKVEVELVDENFLGSDTEEPKLEFDDSFSLTATQMSGIVADASLNTDTVLTIETKLKKVEFSNTGKYKFNNEFNIPTCKGGVKVRFGKPLVDATSKFKENLEFNVKNDYPCKVREVTEFSTIFVIVAPRVGDE